MIGGFEVVDAGLVTTVQDRGRPGFAHLGVPRSGALDQGALRTANRLVGNGLDDAGLETTLTGCVLRAIGTQVVAVAGAFAAVAVDGRPMPWGARLVVPHGALVTIGPAQQGVRCVVAVAGGIQVPAVLGSRSRDTLSALGPEPLSAGDRLPVGSHSAMDANAAEVPFQPLGHRIGMVPGPHADWCDLERLTGPWDVAAESDRVGIRLQGTPVRRRLGEVPPFAMVLGAVQLPPSGLPVVLLADHATTGGYPVVAVVAPEDIDTCAQWRPGDRVTLYWR